MGKCLSCFFIAVGLTLISNNIFALTVPVISYTPSTNIYVSGTAITTLTPANSGGAVGGVGFGAAAALTGATLNNPRGIAFDVSGNVYVTNSGNNTISKYNSGGTYTGNFGSGATMSFPKDLVFDSFGNAYVLNLGASAGTGSIFKYNSSGIYQSTIISGLNYALGITIDASDNIYIADQGAVTVKKYTNAGALLLSLPTINLSTPLGVAIDGSGNIYVLNNGSDNVTKYNPGGVYQSTFLSGFTSPQSITIDGAGNIYIGDNSATNTIYVYNQSGTLLTSRTATDPEGIAVDSKGNIFASSSSASQMNKYSATGGYFLDKILPAGLSFNSTNGSINGTPTATMATTTFTITGYNASGSGNTTVTLTVNPTMPVGAGGSVCGSGAVILTASGSTPAGGIYNWYAALSGGASLGTGATFTTPSLTATTIYYVDYTLNGATSTPRTSVTATVNSQPILATAPTTPTAGLYLSYPFTGNANDVSGNSNTGTVQNAALLTTDRYGAANSAYGFNGSTQYISTATASASPGPQNFSISIWFKTSIAGGRLIGYGSSQTGASGMFDRHIYMSNSGQLYFGLYPGAVKTINTTTTYADGNWHHAVATVSTVSGSNLYVDGALQATDATMTTSQIYGANGYWRVGYDSLNGWTSAPASNYFKGSLDDISVYNSALTATQVYVLYGAGSPPVCVAGALTLQANTVAGATYGWTGPNGFSSTSQNPTVTANAAALNAGVYTLIVTGANGCTSTELVTAVVYALPVSTFTASSPVDVATNSTITYTGTFAATSAYSWNFNGGTIISGSGVGPYTVQWATSGSKTITLTVTNSSGCTSTLTQTVIVNGTSFSTYANRSVLTLNTTGLGSSTDLTNFPFLVSITDPSLIYSSASCSNHVQFPNGPNYDFAFVDAAAGEIPYQVESYNQTAGTLLVWVKLPLLTHLTNNTISFYYGSATAPAAHTAAFYQTTWATDYQAVYHFNETTYTGFVTDGTANGYTGTTVGMTAADLVTGKIGTSYTFNGSNKKITATAPAMTGNFTLSAWVQLATTGIDQKVITDQAASGGNSGGFKLGVYSTNIPESESGVAGNRAATPDPAVFASSAWHYIQSVYSGSTLSTYVDGAQYKILTTGNNPSVNPTLYIGVGEGGTGYYFNGLIDEARVSNVAKSTDWLMAEYTNQNNPSTFTTAGIITTNFANASAINGGIVYTTTNGAAFTYTINGVTTAATPPNNGTASFIIAGNVTQPANASIYSLTVNTGNTLNLNGGVISVGCSVFNNGTINNASGTPSSVIFSGASPTQTYTGTPASVAQLGNLTVNNSSAGTVTVTGGAVSVYTAVNLTSGSLFIDNTNGGALTLKSTATQSASVAAIPATSSITGTVNVERYITGGAGYRGYRLISSPVYAATVSSNNVYSVNYLQTGAYLTGSAGGGFDKTGNPTLYLYREDQAPNNQTFTTGNFWGISKINNVTAYNYYTNGGSTNYNIPVGNGVMFFFRGNRASALVSAETVASYVPVTVTMSTSGTLNQGQVIVHDWYTPTSANLGWTNATANTAVRGFNLVGNPYASSIDWEQYNTTTTTSGIYVNNVSTTMYELNPATNNYDSYQVGGVHTNRGSRTIASGQGFFVLAANGTNPQLIFNETAKTTTQNTGLNLFMAEKAAITALNSVTNQPHLRLQLAKDSINTDDIYIGFNATAKTDYVLNEDATYKQGNGKVSLATISSDNVDLAINKLPWPKLVQTTIPLMVNAVSDGTYKLNMTEIAATPTLYEIWLMDAYKKDSLEMRHNKTYAFDLLKADTNSYGSKRFSLVIRQNLALELHLLNFTGVKSTNGAQLVWVTENEANYTNFTIERSTDNGKTFNVLGGFASSGLGTYSFLDPHPATANEYRLKMESLNGVISYSNAVILNYANSNSTDAGNITVYPNPAGSNINLVVNQRNSTGFPTLQMQGLAPNLVSTPTTAAPQSYNIKIISITGTVIITETSANSVWQKNINNLLPGTYIIEVLNNSDKSLVGKSTFIKL